jgi:hypothetical protein
MGFIQIIEFRTSDIDEIRAVGEEWEAAATDTTARSRVTVQDRDNPGRYFNIVSFDSYEEAMKNSDDPVTQKFSQRLGELIDGQPTFYNLDVIEERKINR